MMSEYIKEHIRKTYTFDKNDSFVKKYRNKLKKRLFLGNLLFILYFITFNFVVTSAFLNMFYLSLNIALLQIPLFIISIFSLYLSLKIRGGNSIYEINIFKKMLGKNEISKQQKEYLIGLSGKSGESLYEELISRCRTLNIIKGDKITLSDLRVLEDVIISSR